MFFLSPVFAHSGPHSPVLSDHVLHAYTAIFVSYARPAVKQFLSDCVWSRSTGRVGKLIEGFLGDCVWSRSTGRVGKLIEGFLSDCVWSRSTGRVGKLIEGFLSDCVWSRSTGRVGKLIEGYSFSPEACSHPGSLFQR